MSKELSKRAADMLLNGATLLSEPCPYCKGVRVMKEGFALCINCGREPKREIVTKKDNKNENLDTKGRLEKKMNDLSLKLEEETDHEKQQEILKSINAIIETIEKLRKQ